MTAPAVVEHLYAPRGAALKLFFERGPEVLLSGPAGTGKSLACLTRLHMLALANPGMRGLIVRKTGVSLTSTGLVTWREHVVKEGLAARVLAYYGGSQEEPPQYRYGNGSRIMIGGLDKSSKIMSSEYDAIFVQEATELTEDDWEALTTRLRNGVISFQQIMADCNPSTPTHWLKSRSDRGQCKLIESRHEDNPMLMDEAGGLTERGADYLAKLDALTGPRYHRLRRGLWVAAEGVVYEDYDPAVHLVDRFWPKRDWVRWWVVDFGYTNPFVWQEWVQDGDGRLYLRREIYRTRRLVEDHAVDIMAAVTKPDRDYVHPAGEPRYAYHGRVWAEPMPRAVICDHDAEDRATLERHLGLGTVAATKTVKDGIEAVMSRLRPAGDGRPRLLFMRDALRARDPMLADAKLPTCTVEEITGYVWPDAGKGGKEQPVKEHDHGMDCMRYMAAEVDLAARPRVRIMG